MVILLLESRTQFFSHQIHYSQQAKYGESRHYYIIMRQHTTLQTHQEEVSKHGEGTEDRKGGCYTPQNE